jgi:type I restriction enzyme S subunit
MREVDEVRVRAGAEAEELPELPAGWAWARLAAITSATLQRVPTEEFLYVDIGSIDSLGHIEVPKQVRPQEAPTRARKDIREGDTILATTRPYLRKIACVPGYLDGHICSTGFCVLRPNAAVVLPGYVFWVARSDVVMLQVISRMRGVAYPAVSDDDVRAAWVPLPPLNEQRRIVARLEELLSGLEVGISSLNRALAKLKRYRQAVLKAAVEGELSREWREAHRGQVEPASELLERILKERLARWDAEQRAKGGRSVKYQEPLVLNTSELPELPKGWEWASLDQLAWVSSYGTSTKCRPKSEGCPVLRITNVVNGRVSLEDLKYASPAADLEVQDALEPGDMLVIRTNGSRDLIGRAAVVVDALDQPHFYASYLIRFRLVPFTGIWAWMNAIWPSGPIRRWIQARVPSSAGQHNISMSTLRALPVPVPPLAEQESIAAELKRRLSEADRLEAALQTNLTRAGRLRQAILKRAFSGELVPQDPSDEPASALLERIQAERGKTPAPKRRGRKHVQARPVKEGSDA